MEFYSGDIVTLKNVHKFNVTDKNFNYILTIKTHDLGIVVHMFPDKIRTYVIICGCGICVPTGILQKIKFDI